MLLAALGATVIGFVLLIVALITANLWLAIGCVVVSVIGVGLLLADVLTYRRAERDSSFASRFGSKSTEKVSESAGDDAAVDGSESSADVAAKSADVAATEPEADRSAADRPAAVPVDEATRESRTVGHEEFGHHDDPAARREHDPVTEQFSTAGWDHESPASTDDENRPAKSDDRDGRSGSVKGLFAPGSYDPDMTDQIPQVELDRAWGSEWEPPEQSDKK